MVGALRLRAAPLASMSSIDNGGLNYKPCLNLRFNSNRRIFTALCIGQSPPSDSSVLTTSVGTASTSPVHLSQWTFTHRHIQILNFAACAAAVSATWLFCSAIPTLLAFKTAAESLEKLMDVTREELPGTMAAIRLSGMEISDLTMELSDLGQQFTQGVRNSTQAVRLAEERLRKLTTMNQSAPMQDITQTVNRAREPVVARTAKGIRLGIVQGRASLQMLFTLTRFLKIAFGYFRARAKAKK